MNNAKFYDDALEIVKQAVEADTKSEPRAATLPWLGRANDVRPFGSGGCGRRCG